MALFAPEASTSNICQANLPPDFLSIYEKCVNLHKVNDYRDNRRIGVGECFPIKVHAYMIIIIIINMDQVSISLVVIGYHRLSWVIVGSHRLLHSAYLILINVRITTV